MKNSTIRLVVLIGSLSIVVILIFQYYWVRKAFDLSKRDLESTIDLALYNVANKVAMHNSTHLAASNPVMKVTGNYYVVDINTEIDEQTLGYYLKTEFEYRNFEIPYVYAIYDCLEEEMRICNANDLTEGLGLNNYCSDIHTVDNLTYYFGIIFPTKSQYIASRMSVWIIFTGVLIVAIVFFSIAISIILRQKRLSEIQKDFINNLTHEFKTPISTIALSAEVISDSGIVNNPERLKSYVHIIREENKRLEKQVEKVLQLAHMEKRDFHLDKTEFEIHEVIEMISGSFKPRLEERSGTLRLDLQAPRTVIYADKIHFTNIIYNLIDNAIKYSKDEVFIEIITLFDDESFKIKISDHGIGIPAAYHKKVFEKFFRVPTGNVHDVKGFGVGLSYVKNIVRAHKWKIQLHVENEKGSTFIIEIPKEQIK